MCVYIGLGANLDSPRDRILEALERLDSADGIRLKRVSSLYRTPPWGYADQPDFCNAVCEVATRLSPRELLDTLHSIERDMGKRPSPIRFGPRRIDLDVLLYRDEVIDEHGLAVPHPRIRERAFVLAPLLEIEPKAADPRDGQPYAPSLAAIPAGQAAIVMEPPPRIGATQRVAREESKVASGE